MKKFFSLILVLVLSVSSVFALYGCNNANENIYSSSNPLDMKLLYVAVTRALHELDIVYTGEVSKPLENHLKNIQKQLIRKK